jgi:hypothetical protein
MQLREPMLSGQYGITLETHRVLNSLRVRKEDAKYITQLNLLI